MPPRATIMLGFAAACLAGGFPAVAQSGPRSWNARPIDSCRRAITHAAEAERARALLPSAPRDSLRIEDAEKLFLPGLTRGHSARKAVANPAIEQSLEEWVVRNHWRISAGVDLLPTLTTSDALARPNSIWARNSLVQHFHKHVLRGREFVVETAEAYLLGAVRLLKSENPTALSFTVSTPSGQPFQSIKFDALTGELVIYSWKSRQITTYYRLREGLLHYLGVSVPSDGLSRALGMMMMMTGN